MTTIAPPRTPGALLKTPVTGPIEPEQSLWGFGGLHGGLSLALMAGAMSAHLPGRPLQSATIRFHRPITEAFRLETSVGHTGRTLTTATARAFTERAHCADATAVFGSPHTGGHRIVTRPAPSVAGPERYERYTVPPEFVPSSVHVEIRPVGSALPYTGGTSPELTAWIRLVEDDEAPDLLRLVFLLDALAPSYSAVLTEPVPIPTVQLTAHPGPGLSRASSPWVLLRAVTRSADENGWIDESIDAWGRDGLHLGSARQLRVVRSG
jgi:hypothetical protein